MTNKADTEAILGAIGDLRPEDMTADGKPKMKELNFALQAAGYDPVSSDERDDAMAVMDAALETNTEPASTEKVTILIRESRVNPVPLHVHGVGQFWLRVGEEHVVPVEALAALRDANINLTILGEQQ